MYRSAANFDGDQRVKLADGGFKRCELQVLVWKYAILWRAVGDTEGDAGLKVLFKGLEPCLSLGLLEDVVEDCLESGGQVEIAIGRCPGSCSHHRHRIRLPS